MGRGDLAKAMKAAEKHKELTKVGYLLPFKVFSEMFAECKEDEKERVWSQVLEGKLPLDYVCKLLSMTRKQCILRLTEYNPHPVYINPETLTLSPGNFIATKQFKNKDFLKV